METAAAAHASQAPRASRASRAAWMVTGALVAADVVFAFVQKFTIPFDSLVVVVGCSALCLGLAWFYTHRRPEPAFRALLETAAFLIVFTAAAASLSYLGASLNLPLRDAVFADADAALGFDWLSHVAFVAQRPHWIAVLTAAYNSCGLQLALIFAVLAIRRDWARLAEFRFLVAGTGTVVIVIAALLPSVGAYVFHAPSRDVLGAFSDAAVGRWHLGDFEALRSGAMRVIPLRQAEGLVTFPSFHTALAFVFGWALIGDRWLGPPMVVLNAVMVLSTLAIGGHYLVDVIAGAAIALGFILYAPSLRRPARASGTVSAAGPFNAGREGVSA